MQHGGIACKMFMRKGGRKKWERNLVSWYRLAKEAFGQERYVKDFGSNGEVRLRIRLRMVLERTLG